MEQLLAVLDFITDVLRSEWQATATDKWPSRIQIRAGQPTWEAIFSLANNPGDWFWLGSGVAYQLV